MKKTLLYQPLKTLSFIFFAFIFTDSFSQSYPLPDMKDCISPQKEYPVIEGKIVFVYNNDSLQQYAGNFSQIDGFRVVYNDTCPFAPLIRRGILNGNVMNDVGFNSYDRNFFTYESDMPIKVINESGQEELWNGNYIFFGSEFLDSISTGQKRVFKLDCTSGGLDGISYFYFELINPKANSNTQIAEFMEGAYIACLRPWYNRI